MNISFAICGSTGSGKTTIVNEFLKNNNLYSKAISCTTRSPRPNEVEGIDYYFKTFEEFEEIKDDLIEYDLYNNNYYGMQKKEIEKDNKIAILTPKGIVAVKTILGQKIISIRIISSDIEKQLLLRNDAYENIKKRLQIYKNDIKNENELQEEGYIDLVICNDYGRFDDAVEKFTLAVNRYCKATSD